MSHYLVLVQRFVDGAPSAKGLFEYETLDAARVASYNNMANSMGNDNIKDVLCIVLSETGSVERYDYWEREESITPDEKVAINEVEEE